jgi:hypothetical protein
MDSLTVRVGERAAARQCTVPKGLAEPGDVSSEQTTIRGQYNSSLPHEPCLHVVPSGFLS